jgi:hypothetical protein
MVPLAAVKIAADKYAARDGHGEAVDVVVITGFLAPLRA